VDQNFQDGVQWPSGIYKIMYEPITVQIN